MKKVLAVFLAALMLLSVGNLFAEDLNLTFESDADVSHWGNHDQTNMWTTVAYDATGGIDGTGALKFADAGWGFLMKRPVNAVAGSAFTLTVSVKTSGWDAAHNLYLKVEGFATKDSVVVNSDGVFTQFTISGTATANTGYIKLEGMNGGVASEVWIDNLTFDDGADVAPIVINEIYYNPPTMQGSDTDYEFFELYNTTTSDIPLEGYSISEGVVYDFVTADTIKAGGYLVLAQNGATYPGSIQWTSGGLKNSGEDVAIKDAAGNTVDSVDYDDYGSDWPYLADGYGASLSLKDPALDHNDPASWYPSAFGGTPGAANGPRGIRVHFTANTATVPDTMGMYGIVQVRGSNPPLQWNGTSLVVLQAENGGQSDYWTGSAIFPEGVTNFKFYTNASHNEVFGGAEWEHQGWEADISQESNDRILDLTGFAGTDTTLPVEYVNGWSTEKPGQYAHPWTDNDSTFTVWLRVNMEGFQAFDPDQHVVGVRGSNTSDWGQTGEISWGTTYLLSPEADHANGGSRQYKGANFYSGAVHVPMRYKDAGLSWKFVVHYKGHDLSEDWGLMFHNPSLQDQINFSGSGNDTTIYWRWFDNMKPIKKANEDTVIITYKADMTDAINRHGFQAGDTVVVRAGWNGTASEIVSTMPMEKEGLGGQIYSVTDTIITTIGDQLQYNYYIIKDGIEYREVFYDFTDSLGGTAAEKRKVMITGSPAMVEDVLADPGELHRMPVFRNLEKTTQELTVYYEVDMRPAYFTVLAGKTLQDIQGNYNVEEADSVFAWGVWINGPATGGWQTWGSTLENDTTRKMYDDGTHGDLVAGDSIYTQTFVYPAGTVKGQEFKFGVRGGDNEGGYGNNHVENLDDSEPTQRLFSQFGSIDPLFYDAWDYTGLVDVDPVIPAKYELDQNYPNPFNPSTTINFALVKAGKVNLTVYNVLGQKVATLLNNELATAGTHAVKWNGLDNAGNKVASGVYFYKLQAGNFTSVKKMILMK